MHQHMNTPLALQETAIKAAQNSDWPAGIQANLEILEQEPDNISALNRLGYCYLQTGKSDDANTAYKKVLRIDKYNPIAKKYIALLAGGQPVAVSAGFFHESFIEEPGITKSIQLCRLADPKSLLPVAVGTSCILKVKAHRIAVETEQGTYLGSLPDDLSHHLGKLITAGNKYRVVVQSISKTTCTVFIKELSRTKRFLYTPSFPLSPGKNHASDVREELMIDQPQLDLTETGLEEDMDATPLPDEPEEENERR